MTAAELGSVVGRLARENVAGLSATAAPADAYWEAAGLDSAQARSGTGAAHRIRLISLAGAGADEKPVHDALSAAGLGLVPDDAGPGDEALTIVLCDTYLDPMPQAPHPKGSLPDR
ncbi:hypothetical protein [Streptomyces sp. NBC_01618]|uniref:hypothetical protein n=1 Tax=Streptomyces sp. NBC_01618 TaxID=2975900 RepID=UPI00386BE66C|nr:hypothetical protein OH735_03540 [Streptomyces sp. NBC_01618]